MILRNGQEICVKQSYLLIRKYQDNRLKGWKKQKQDIIQKAIIEVQAIDDSVLDQSSRDGENEAWSESGVYFDSCI